jgi:hypothetical protein
MLSKMMHPKQSSLLQFYGCNTKKLGIKIEHFSHAPMHILFLGVTKHLVAHVDCLFGKNSNYWKFCKIILEHIKFGKDISLDWCPIADFADVDSISTNGWQSVQYIAFSCPSLVYFGLVEDLSNIINRTNVKTFWQVFVVWFLLILSLFLECVCNPELVDDYVRLSYPLVFAMGCRQKKLPKILLPKKG